MTPAFHELWGQYQRGEISRATFFRKKQALKAGDDGPVVDRHPACWQAVNGRWHMTREYSEIWYQFKTGWISRASFFRRKKELKEAYDSEEVPF